MSFQNAVCRGSLALKSGCGRCERCDNERRQMQAASAEKADAYQLPLFDDQKATSPIAGHSGLPVAGYAKTVEQWKVDMVNENKRLEELVLRRVDAHVRNRDSQEIDQASVQIARRHVEDAFYRLNRAIMQPKRILGDLA